MHRAIFWRVVPLEQGRCNFGVDHSWSRELSTKFSQNQMTEFLANFLCLSKGLTYCTGLRLPTSAKKWGTKHIISPAGQMLTGHVLGISGGVDAWPLWPVPV